MSAKPRASGAPAAPSRARRAARGAAWAALALVALAIALVAAIGYLATSSGGLSYVMAQAQRLTGGRLVIEGAQGSLLSKLNVRELRWRGATTTIVARNVFVEWNPSALAHRRIDVGALGAESLDVAIAAGADGSPATLPQDLALPLDVSVAHASVTKLDWKLGERSGRVTGIAFGYQGGATGHRLDDVALGFEQGRLSGQSTLAAVAPFDITGSVDFAADPSLGDVAARATIAGTLMRMAVDARGHVGSAAITARAQATPFGAAPIDTLDIEANDVDLASFGEGWPHSALTLLARARPTAQGFAGTLSLRNAMPGAIDANRIPLETLTATFAQQGEHLALHDIDARVAEGSARGRADIAFDDRTLGAALTLDAVNLHALHGALVATRVRGRIDAAIDRDVQQVEGTLADRERQLSLDFNARVARQQLTLSRARLVAAAGTLDGRGELSFDGRRAFGFAGSALHFDPSRLGDFPKGSLDGAVTISGTLEPAWALVADATLAPGATLAGRPASGSIHAALAAGAAHDVAVDVGIGKSHVQASGSAGKAGDTLTFALDAPDVGDIVPLLPAPLRDLQRGAFHAKGTLNAAPGAIGGHVSATVGELALANGVVVASATVEADIAAPGAASTPLARRAIDIKVSANGIADATHALDRVSATVRGTLADHRIDVELANAADRIVAAAHGALSVDARTPPAWRGTLDSLTTSGALAASLEAPATVEWSPSHSRIGAMRIAVVGGHVAIDDLTLDQGRLSTHGGFDHLPVAAVAAIAGTTLPLASTLTLKGAWSLAATPRLSGSIDIDNDSGDLFASSPATSTFADYPLGIRSLTLRAKVQDDAWDVRATLDSLRAGNATLAATLAPGPESGVPSLDAPVTLKLGASLASLAPFQPWLGTSAVVEGRLALDITAEGTLRKPVVSGTLDGETIRVDAPQWGVALADGRVRASLMRNAVTLDELLFKGGNGTFSAHGTLAAAGTSAAEGARVAWRADHFRLLNRPDLRMVISGDGTMNVVPHKIALTGTLNVDEGSIVYTPTAALLGDDVVIKDRPRNEGAAQRTRIPALELDLRVDLGRALEFSGEGLDAHLGGKVHVTSGDDGRLNGQGSISIVRGSYFAFGQKLTIDRGRLIFDGPLDNPALDVVALRKNLAVEAGVALTGTVRVPRVQLTSNPAVPDDEKLSWLITGQPPGNGNSADAAALAAASAWLMGGNSRPIGTRIAHEIGLDDISVRSSSSGSTSGSANGSGQVLAIGKRLSEKLSLVYEQGLTIATNALRLEYALTRSWTLRAEAGTVSGVGIFFRRSYR